MRWRGKEGEGEDWPKGGKKGELKKARDGEEKERKTERQETLKIKQNQTYKNWYEFYY